MSAAMIQLSGIAKAYSGQTVLEIPELEIGRRRRVGIVGPNGAGKTTLLRICAMIEAPDSGEYRLDGRLVPAGGDLAARRKITLVMQRAVLFNASVFNNVAYGLRVRGCAPEDIRGRTIKALQRLGLQGFADRHARKLSSGEAQRVALARALAFEPEVLLLDEPTANIDVHNVPMVEDALTAMQRERGATVVFTTHQTEQALRLAQDMVHLAGGGVIRAGLENIFHARALRPGEDTPLVELSPAVTISAVHDRQGPVMVHIPPQDIILSHQPLESSARNRLEGVIASIQTRPDNTIAVGVDVAGLGFTSHITAQSYRQMGLAAGARICLSFKSTAVRVH